MVIVGTSEVIVWREGKNANRGDQDCYMGEGKPELFGGQDLRAARQGVKQKRCRHLETCPLAH